MRLKMDKGDLVLTRQGDGLTMKIQSKDCALGGIFQMEVARSDNTATVCMHMLGETVFYYDNRNVRNRLGENIRWWHLISNLQTF